MAQAATVDWRALTAALPVLLVFLFNLLPKMALATERHALVIGNSEYRQSPLRNPVNDAEDMAQTLAGLGYRVHQNRPHLNVNREQMDNLLNGFTDQLPEDSVALFYFAGHGANDEREQSHLIPVGANIRRESQIKHRALSLSYVAETLQDVNKKGLNILLVDACRDRPFGRGFTRSSTRGLLRPAVIPNGTFIGLAAGEGQVAEDGANRNGVYTRHLLDALRTRSHEPIEAVHKSIAEAVYIDTASRAEPQRPVFQSDFFGTYCFGDCFRATPQPELLTGRLTVKTEPPDARVRIMNIVPKYREGIELDLGREYDVLVTRDGYDSWRRVVKLTELQQVVPVVLESRLPVADPNTQPELSRRLPFEPEMVLIRGGCYQMGSPVDEEGRSSKEHQHEVCVGDMYASKYEVTFEQYDAFVEATGRRKPADAGFGREKRPVIYVDWDDATAYAEWLSVVTGRSYRLPTEAEWEYAARGGTKTAYHTGRSISGSQGNFIWEQNAFATGRDGTVSVGSYRANPFGLYDVHGNVWEWTCSDYDENYSGAEQHCSDGGIIGQRVLRGGSWDTNQAGVRSASRWGPSNIKRFADIGIRLFQDIK